MIPKIIHYCWFGKGLMPQSQKNCIKSWQKIMPDYKIMRWDESNFDVNTCEYTQQAYQAKKYAYVSDVARCKALLEYGGIYLDTDVEVFERFDRFLNASFFSAIEIYSEFYKEGLPLLNDNNIPAAGEDIGVPYLGILSSILGAEPNNPLIVDCWNYYNELKNNRNEIFTGITIDGLMARMAIKYGFSYKDELQNLEDNMVIYPTGIFGYAYAPNPEYCISYHHNAATWQPKSKKQKRLQLLDKLHLLPLYNAMRKVKNKYLKV